MNQNGSFAHSLFFCLLHRQADPEARVVRGVRGRAVVPGAAAAGVRGDPLAPGPAAQKFGHLALNARAAVHRGAS